MRRSLLGLSMVMIACGSPPPPAVDAAPAIDAGTDAWFPRDAGHDASPAPGPRYCGLCHTDSECGGGTCLVLGSEHVCGALCTSDADCRPLDPAASCVEVGAGLPHQCQPTSGTCIESAPGSACSDAMPCSGTFDVCHPFDGVSACTARCTGDADCPIGMHHCDGFDVFQFCQPDRAYGMDECGASVVDPAPICTCSSESASSISGQLLASIGLTACSLHFDPAAIDSFGPAVAHDRFRMGFTDRIRSYAPDVPQFGRSLASALDMGALGATPVTTALSESATLADLDPVRPVVPTDATDLAGELAALVTAAGGSVDMETLTSATMDLSDAAQLTIAPIVRATRNAVLARETAIAGLDPATRIVAFDLASGLFLPALGPPPSFADPNVQGLLLGDVHVGQLAETAINLSATIETYDVARLVGTEAHLFVDTPAGAIVFSGASDDVHDLPAVLLMIDFGGNDTYRGPMGANASPANGVSIVLDAGGIDDYGYDPNPVTGDTDGPPDSRRLTSDSGGRATPTGTSGPYSQSRVSRQGAGRLGIGMLFDFGTDDDHYQSLRMSQGYGALGIGVLYDQAGDDRYDGEAAVQGAAAFGIGLLFDPSGDDHYSAYAYAQGFGYSRGIGTLYDAQGTDDYFSHPTDVLYDSVQNPGGSNASFSQGAGLGRRANGAGEDGVDMSGGLGVLRDAGGDDTYTVGIFGQGTGVWFGTGLLLEANGNDHYDGWWYVQGSAVQYAAAALLDDAGGDTYQVSDVGDPARSTSMGVGDDFSIGWLVDRAGDDIYHAPNLSLGAGNAAGYGFFFDLAGNDTYVATTNFSFGDASIAMPGDTLRAMAGTIGLFVDRSGTDSYMRPTLTPVSENTMWTQSIDVGMGEHGAGTDTLSGTIGLGLD